MAWTPEAAIRGELLPGEAIRWIGSPGLGAMFMTQLGQIVASLLGLFVCALWIFYDDKADSIGGLSFYGFVTVACGVTIGIAIWNTFAASRTAYGITDRRLLIVRQFVRRSVLAVSPNAINTVEHRERSNGRGSITFRRETTGKGETEKTITLSFVGVHDVRGAIREIEKLRPSA